MKNHLLSLLLLAGSFTLTAQHGTQPVPDAADLHEDHYPHWRIALVLGHTFVPTAHTPEYTAIPSWGVDLEYWFNAQFGLGLHNDLEIESFIVIGSEGEEIDRVYPVVLTLDALWRPYKGWVLQAGPGIELEQEENYFVVRFGLEYEIELSHHWDLVPTFFYDSRQGAYDTWSIGLGVGKRF
jgi:hypothetical protein